MRIMKSVSFKNLVLVIIVICYGDKYGYDMECCVAGNGLAIVAMTSRPSPNCSTQLMMTSSTGSKPTLRTFSSQTDH